MAITTQMRTDVANLYVSLFGRAPERDGLGFWVNQLNDGRTVAQVAEEMYNTAPARNTYPTYLTNEEIVGKFYSNVLGRTADAEGLAFWTNKLNEGQAKGELIAEMIAAVQSYAGTDAAALASKALLANKVAVGLYYAVDLGGNDVAKATTVLTAVTADAASVQAAKDSAASVTGQTFNLTSGVDALNGTSGNDSFVAVVGAGTATSPTTLNALDTLEGGAGNDTLVITDTSAGTLANPASFSMKNIESLTISSNSAVGTTTARFNVSSATDFAGLTNVNITNTGGASYVQAAAGQTVAVTNTTGAVDVLGGKAVTTLGASGAAKVSSGALTSASVTTAGRVIAAGAATAVATDTGTNGAGVQINDTSVTTGVTAKTLTSVTLNKLNSAASTVAAAGSNGDATIAGDAVASVTLANNTNNTVTVTNATAAHAMALTLNNTGVSQTTFVAGSTSTFADATAGSLAVTLAGTNNDAAINAAQAKSVTVAGTKGTLNLAGVTSATSLDGSAATGDLTFTNLSSTLTSVKTGAGSDTFSVTASVKAAVDSGAGNDTVSLASAVAAGSTINLAAGNDVLKSGGGSVAVSTATVIDGGEGTDTVSSLLLNAANSAQFKNFEYLGLENTTGSFDASLVAGVTGVALTGATGGGTYTGMTTALGAHVVANSTGVSTLTFTGVTGLADAYTVSFEGAGAATATAAAPTTIGAGTLAIAGIENLTINAGGTGFVNDTITVSDANLRTVTVTGAATAVNLGFAAGTGNATGAADAKDGVALIDASAATGNVTVSLNNVTAATAGLAVVTGAGKDTITTSTFASKLTGGAGADNFIVSAAVYGSGAGVVTNIVDFAAGDKITFADKGAETFNATKVTLGASVTNLTTAILAAKGTANAATNANISWFQYGSDTYIVESTTDQSGGAATAVDAADLVIKLTGLIDLSNATFTSGASTAVATLVL